MCVFIHNLSGVTVPIKFLLGADPKLIRVCSDGMFSHHSCFLTLARLCVRCLMRQWSSLCLVDLIKSVV